MCQKTSNHVIGKAKGADRKFIFADGVGDKAKINKSSIWILTILVINLLFFSFIPVINLSNNSHGYKLEGGVDIENDKFNDIPTPITPKTSASIFENLTINSGDELYENRNYDFNSSFYDSSNKTKEYTNAELQTKLIGDDTIFNDSISNLNNSEIQQALNTSITMINGTSDYLNNMTMLDDYYTTYNSTEAGHYPATYSFKDDADGSNPSGWSVDLGGGTGTINVKAYSSTHRKVVEIKNNVGAQDLKLYQALADKTSGTIEFYARVEQNNKWFWIKIWDGGAANCLQLAFSNAGTFQYYDGAWKALPVPTAYVVNTWYHIKIVFDCTGAFWFPYIDGVAKGNCGYRGNPTAMDYIEFAGIAETSTQQVDAIGYSWDTNYNVGDNLNMIPSELNFTLTFDFANYNQDLIAIEVFAYYYTSIIQMINFSIFNFTSGLYFLINSSFNSADFHLSYYLNDTNAFDDFINSSGSIILNFYGVNTTSEFQLFLDYCGIKIYYKLQLSILKAFNIKGNWKSRYHVIGSDYYSSWVYFEVIVQPYNFEGISESEYTTKWVLISQDLVESERFHETFDAGSWGLYDITGDRVIEIDSIPTDDSMACEELPDYNYGNFQFIEIYDHVFEMYGFFKYEYTYLDLNYTSNSILRVYYTYTLNNIMEIYNTADFDEDTITWNNMPFEDTLLDSHTCGTGWKDISVTEPHFYYLLKLQDDATDRLIQMESTEKSGYEPTIQHYLSKNYHGDGMIYIQTDETETLNIRREYAANTSLISGDTITFDLESTAPDINLRFYSDGIEQKEITVLSGNSNNNRQTVEVLLDEDVEFDQLMFTGDFHDPEHFICYDILVEGYNVLDDVYEFYVDPDGIGYTTTNPGNYTLKIYEFIGGDFNLRITKNITLTFGLFTEIYVPEVFDYYYLKIYHYAYELSIIEISGPENKTLTADKDEVLEILLKSGDYIVNWTNGETGKMTSYNIVLYSNKILVLSSTYTTIYFSLYNFDGFGVDRNLLRFYINDSRKDFGFNTIRGSHANLVVNDYWYFNLYNKTIQVNDTIFEFDIQVEIYTLIINNNYSQQLRFEIYREGLSGNITQYIPAHYSWPFMFYPTVKYRIRAYYINGTFLEEKEILLTENFQEVDFGFHKEPITDLPEFPTGAEVITNIILIIVIFSLVVVILSISIIYVVKRNKKLRNQPILEIEQGKGRQSEISLRKKLYT